ncbi:MAG: pantoate--beta-alanine ligase [Bacteroidetes bacterium]|nr:pantoate--beta-alanine ligase [Bacteroidota bacterium]MCB9044255.1 pantoate--beta-alanine ligase [Chitinophagales bacterium]
MQAFLAHQKGKVGFVPTMGALHEGHLALIAQAKEQADWVVCSIFVNPTQFNDAQDLAKYPRTEEADIKLLLLHGKCDVLYLPDVAEIYPSDNPLPKYDYDFGNAGKVLEAAHRPGHFEGVAQVVRRLLEIVKPDQLFMGQKDFQQVIIVRKMLEQSPINTELIACPTIREESGLARSSRNTRLSASARLASAEIYKTLRWVAANFGNLPPDEICAKAVAHLAENLLFQPEYFEIVSVEDLTKITDYHANEKAVACTAVYVEGVRLIDNILLN